MKPLLRQEYVNGTIQYVSIATGEVWGGNGDILNPKLVLGYKAHKHYQCRKCGDYQKGNDWCGQCQRFRMKVKKPKAGQESEQDRFDRYRRNRAKKHGKKHYEYGKALATNFAAPFIARLRKEAKNWNHPTFGP